jgi:hypothetical protein
MPPFLPQVTIRLVTREAHGVGDVILNIGKADVRDRTTVESVGAVNGTHHGRNERQ